MADTGPPTPGAGAGAVERSSLTLRIVMASPSASAPSTLLRLLGVQAGAQVQVAESEGRLVESVTFHAGLFEGHPLRLEVTALTGAPADGPQVPCDVVVLVVDTAAQDQSHEPWLAGWEQRWAPEDPLHRPAAVLFVHRRQGEPGAPGDELVVGPGALAAVPVAATADDGSGVRFAFALAVRAGVQRTHARDAADLARSSPHDSASLPARWRPEGEAPVAGCDAVGVTRPPAERRRVDPPQPRAASGADAATDCAAREPLEAGAAASEEPMTFDGPRAEDRDRGPRRRRSWLNRSDR